MVLRLTGGKWKGKQVQASRGRPTSSLVRQALFEILPCLQEESVLDLFAGSGTLSFEALSRGAQRVLAVDRCRMACSVMRENKRMLSIETDFAIFKLDVYVALKRLSGRAQFKYIFADPPYDCVDSWIQSPGLFDQLENLLCDGGYFVLEHATRSSIPFSDWKGSYQIKTYGERALSFFLCDSSRDREKIAHSVKSEKFISS